MGRRICKRMPPHLKFLWPRITRRESVWKYDLAEEFGNRCENPLDLGFLLKPNPLGCLLEKCRRLAPADHRCAVVCL